MVTQASNIFDSDEVSISCIIMSTESNNNSHSVKLNYHRSNGYETVASVHIPSNWLFIVTISIYDRTVKRQWDSGSLIKYAQESIYPTLLQSQASQNQFLQIHLCSFNITTYILIWSIIWHIQLVLRKRIGNFSLCDNIYSYQMDLQQ